MESPPSASPRNHTPIRLLASVRDRSIRELLQRWMFENPADEKTAVKEILLELAVQLERDAFFIRFILKEFDSWNHVLTTEESDVARAHDREYYRPHLLAVLQAHGGKMEPARAIREVLERVKNELTPADFAMTSSRRVRYDANIRSIVDELKRQGVLSRKPGYKQKYWALAEEDEKVQHEMF